MTLMILLILPKTWSPTTRHRLGQVIVGKVPPRQSTEIRSIFMWASVWEWETLLVLRVWICIGGKRFMFFAMTFPHCHCVNKQDPNSKANSKLNTLNLFVEPVPSGRPHDGGRGREGFLIPGTYFGMHNFYKVQQQQAACSSSATGRACRPPGKTGGAQCSAAYFWNYRSFILVYFPYRSNLSVVSSFIRVLCTGLCMADPKTV